MKSAAIAVHESLEVEDDTEYHDIVGVSPTFQEEHLEALPGELATLGPVEHLESLLVGHTEVVLPHKSQVDSIVEEAGEAGLHMENGYTGEGVAVNNGGDKSWPAFPHPELVQ